ncbi:hypothetical protein [Sporomusa sp.]|uniref:hypothetical protein n=1 Tax=Sporomusa sp. TaxID=2078658 RepID=UPI002BBF0721|nr:hypothetical protein [Sporomusa sp.]HWR45814.1 hypothetical protein [Sporomusa sp.]
MLRQDFGRDPFLIFELRGKSRSDLMRDLARQRASINQLIKVAAPPLSQSEPDIPVDGNAFWEAFGELGHIPLDPAPCQTESIPVLKVLGPPPHWPDSLDFFTIMSPIYHHIFKKMMPH